ncbi:hypothetical protein HPP92_028753 [Vanilla planifolia]|uniref:Uncharacterized protein n=1 Tax=Vanilla planifolia TaxID=51239 RepID=A0A835P9S4_VANPL|nr:hypothetical protein HPP92_028753 [Vanilla planifolia]
METRDNDKGPICEPGQGSPAGLGYSITVLFAPLIDASQMGEFVQWNRPGLGTTADHVSASGVLQTTQRSARNSLKDSNSWLVDASNVLSAVQQTSNKNLIDRCTFSRLNELVAPES